MKTFSRLCGCIFLSLFLLTAAQFAVAEDESESYKGLWVGEVLLDHVSMLFPAPDDPEPNEPKETADTVSMRVILHINEKDETYLLSYVVLAQSAGAEQEMLFTDEEELSKWIKDQEEQGTKFAVRRIETASYDLPKKDPGKPEEGYELAHRLDGELAPGNTVKTRAGTLVIDESHRSNPFRHVYHEQHTEGYRIVREMQFTFDEEPSDAGKSQANYGVEVLTGDYLEAVSGVVKKEINISGRFTLYKISSVDKLNE